MKRHKYNSASSSSSSSSCTSTTTSTRIICLILLGLSTTLPNYNNYTCFASLSSSSSPLAFVSTPNNSNRNQPVHQKFNIDSSKKHKKQHQNNQQKYSKKKKRIRKKYDEKENNHDDSNYDDHNNNIQMIMMDDSSKKNKESSSTTTSKKYHPPWLQSTNLSSSSSTSQQQSYIHQSQAKYNLYTLRQKLHQHHINHPSLFTLYDITTVINSIFVASQNNISLISSTALFLCLLLDVEEDYGDNFYNNNNNENDGEKGEEENKKQSFIFMSKDTLVASSFHYCECVIAREMGLYDVIHSVMRSIPTDGDNDNTKRLSMSTLNQRGNEIIDDAIHNTGDNDIIIDDDWEENPNLLLSPLVQNRNHQDQKLNHDNVTIDISSNNYHQEKVENDDIIWNQNQEMVDDDQQQQQSVTKYDEQNQEEQVIIDENIQITNAINNGEIHKVNIASFGSKATQIYQNVARLKRAEIMSHAMLPRSQPPSSQSISISKVTPSPEKAATLRGLMLSTTDGDWNALAIRLTASLYRLRGILNHQKQNYYTHNYDENEAEMYNKEIVREAREALQIYAPLAQRLGMSKLKTELENQAFRILYKRQYVITKSLYMKNGAGGSINGGIVAVATYLEKEIESILHSDKWLADQLDRLTVTSRVKQPYSLWRKLLKLKMKGLKRKKIDPLKIRGSNDDSETETVTETYNDDDIPKNVVIAPESILPSISLVQDAIALRVIVKGKENIDQIKNIKKTSDKFLCYYIQNLLMKSWPAVDKSRVKDYISQPKPNGYQSLHHTSFVYKFGQRWPFEVQVRSEDMHTKSEFGVAAHWDYKLKSRELQHANNNAMILKPQILPSRILNIDDDSIEETDSMKSAQSLSSSISSEVIPTIPSLQPAAMIEAYINALDTARSHLLKKNVFIFFLSSQRAAREGRVLGIPVGSTVFDAYVEICNRCQIDLPTFSDNFEFGAYLNGQNAHMADFLNTGDILIIPSLEGKISNLERINHS